MVSSLSFWSSLTSVFLPCRLWISWKHNISKPSQCHVQQHTPVAAIFPVFLQEPKLLITKWGDDDNINTSLSKRWSLHRWWDRLGKVRINSSGEEEVSLCTNQNMHKNILKASSESYDTYGWLWYLLFFIRLARLQLYQSSRLNNKRIRKTKQL